MADPSKQYPENVPGPFFVDTTCIDCDTCRQLAPGVFAEANEDHSFVQHQPSTAVARREAQRALLCCPTGSIGDRDRTAIAEVMADFPLPLAEDVFYAGFNSAKSYGGNAYFVRHPEGNWLIDSPRFVPQLVKRLEALGGIRYLFLTHRDDVAEAARYAERFGAERIIHQGDRSAMPDAEIVIEGQEAREFRPGFKIIPTPGHTRGHMVLLYQNRYLFTGDHLAWSREAHALSAHPSVCWYSWPEQTASMARLLQEHFSWILPGHGQRIELPEAEMRRQLQALVARMQTGAPADTW